MHTLAFPRTCLILCCSIGAAWIGCSGASGNPGGAAGAGGASLNAGGASSGGANAPGGTNPTQGGDTNTGQQSGGNSAVGGANANGTGGTPNGGNTAATSGGASAGGSKAAGGATAVMGGSSGTGVGGRGAGGAATGGKAEGGAGAGGKAANGGASAGGSSAGGSSSASCGSTTHNLHPFGCNFAWGIASPSGSLSGYGYLQFVSQWAGSNITASGTFPSFNNASWLNSLASTNLVPAYYAYIIGYLGHANGLPDGNLGGPPNLTTGGATLIRNQRAAIISAYAWYAQQTYAVWKTKPLVWLLEGDFVQYAGTSQTNPLSYTELGQLAADITCAIKSNMPNAVVAVNHSPWNADAVTDGFWNGMAAANYDLVWTTGLGNANGFIPANTTASSYNGKTATYAYVHNLTGRTILVDTSAGASAAGDSWSTASASDLNSRISEGVIAANITGSAPSNLQSNIASKTLNAIPSCP